MSNLTEAISWFSQGESVQLQDNQFAISSTKERIYRFFSKNYDTQQIKAIADLIQKQLQKAPQEREEYLRLAAAFITRHQNDWFGGRIAEIFDRAISPFRKTAEFVHPANREKYQKWVRYGMPPEIYIKHPHFCSFLEMSGLLSQMKVTRDTIREIDGEPAILVDGKWTRSSQLKELFKVRKSLRYNNETFLIHKQTNMVYTYLDNGKGLQRHHPYITENRPISILNEEKYQRLIRSAKTFVRPGEEHLSEEQRQRLNASRPFVLQLVSSSVAGADTRFHDLLVKPKHPYLRIVVGTNDSKHHLRRGEVFEMGYGWKEPVCSLKTTQGQFRSPDVWEYFHCEERVVTNIPISEQEAHALRAYTLKYHRDGINLGNPVAFHLTRQNCSTYVRKAMAVAGIQVHTEIDLAAFIHEIAPEWLVQVAGAFGQLYSVTKSMLNWSVSLLPDSFCSTVTSVAEKVSSCFHLTLEALTALVIAPFNAMLGGSSGKEGQAFVPPNTPARQIGPTLSSWKSWLTLSAYRIDLPGILQRWQRKQASTVCYNKPIRLSIVP